MTTHNNEYTLDEAVRIDLANHPKEEYRRIIEQFRGPWPTAHTYLVEAAMDVDNQADLAAGERLASEGVKTEAWIGFEPGHARVSLNPHYYADTPADELQAEAENVLQDWAQTQRKALHIDGPPAPGPTGANGQPAQGPDS